MIEVNRSLVPIKAHYFLFMAAMGPIFPQINVFGKKLGISPDAIGLIACAVRFILPIKSFIGYFIDYFPKLRKLIFICITSFTLFCFSGFAFIPKVPGSIALSDDNSIDIKNESIVWCSDDKFSSEGKLCADILSVDCAINNISFTGIISKTSDKIQMKTSTCDLSFASEAHCKLTKEPYEECFYRSLSFWMFVAVVFFGMIAYNVSNCLSDVVCFDMLSNEPMKYGRQRVWGTIGYGTTAFLSGIIVHFYQTKPNDPIQAIIPALVIMMVFGIFDIISIKWLSLPKLSENNESIFDKVCDLVSQKQIATFLIFVVIAGILDSFITYYMFWYLEEVAEQTNFTSSIKLIEGCVIAAECFGGEIIFMLISANILKRIGYKHCLTLCFFMYSIRFLLISLIPNPWWLVIIEVSFHGCSYALTYTCIVAYAALIAPPGTSATVQALVAGMNDGAGYAIGSIVGGQMYGKFGGRACFQVYAFAAAVTGVARLILLRNGEKKIDENNNEKEKETLAKLVKNRELEPLHCETLKVEIF